MYDTTIANSCARVLGVLRVVILRTSAWNNHCFQQQIEATGGRIWAVQYRKVIYKLERGTQMKLKDSQWACARPGQLGKMSAGSDDEDGKAPKSNFDTGLLKILYYSTRVRETPRCPTSPSYPKLLVVHNGGNIDGAK